MSIWHDVGHSGVVIYLVLADAHSPRLPHTHHPVSAYVDAPLLICCIIGSTSGSNRYDKPEFL